MLNRNKYTYTFFVMSENVQEDKLSGRLKDIVYDTDSTMQSYVTFFLKIHDVRKLIVNELRLDAYNLYTKPEFVEYNKRKNYLYNGDKIKGEVKTETRKYRSEVKFMPDTNIVIRDKYIFSGTAIALTHSFKRTHRIEEDTGVNTIKYTYTLQIEIKEKLLRRKALKHEPKIFPLPDTEEEVIEIIRQDMDLNKPMLYEHTMNE